MARRIGMRRDGRMQEEKWTASTVRIFLSQPSPFSFNRECACLVLITQLSSREKADSKQSKREKAHIAHLNLLQKFLLYGTM